MYHRILRDIVMIQILQWHVHIDVILDIYTRDDIDQVDIIFHERVYEYVHEVYRLIQ